MITGTHTGQYTTATSGAGNNIVDFAAYSACNGHKNNPVYRHPDYADYSDVVNLNDHRR